MPPKESLAARGADQASGAPGPAPDDPAPHRRGSEEPEAACAEASVPEDGAVPEQEASVPEPPDDAAPADPQQPAAAAKDTPGMIPPVEVRCYMFVS